MHKRKLMALAVILVILAAGTIVFAESDNVKTHEYNFANKAFFNISDDLTNETEFKLSPQDSLDVGVDYTYPEGKVICSLWCVGEDGVTDFEGHQKIHPMKKSQVTGHPKDTGHISSKIQMNMMYSLNWII